MIVAFIYAFSTIPPWGFHLHSLSPSAFGIPKEWQDFPTFDRWVSNSLQDLEELVGLVVFHPSSSLGERQSVALLDCLGMSLPTKKVGL
jgi:hypothetical protein